MRCAVVFEKTMGAYNIIPADAVCVQGGITGEGGTWGPNNSAYRIRKGIASFGGFENGETWTFNAGLTNEAPPGAELTCKVHLVGITQEGGMFTALYGTLPASGTAALPFTFTITNVPKNDAACALIVELAYGETWGAATEISPGHVTALSLVSGDGSTPQKVETCALGPDEISENAVLTKAKNSKANVVLTIFPGMEAWDFCERSVTYATVYDLDLPEDRIIFAGRVTGVTSSLDNKYSQEVTLASAVDFLEDTSLIQMPYHADYKVNAWLTRQFETHNNAVDSARQITLNSTIADADNYHIYVNAPNKMYGNIYEGISQVSGGEKLYRTEGSKYVYNETSLEFAERYEDGTVFFDVAEKLGGTGDTAIVIGENLLKIAVEKSIDSGIYSGVKVISGVNSDGDRGTRIAYNAEMVSRYGSGRIKNIVVDSICYKGSATVYDPDTGQTHETEEYQNYLYKLNWCARQEARKLSDPPVKISLAAKDLAAMGYTGYESFELYDSYPVVCPKLGLYGDMLRITKIRRRLCDGRVESMTIERGQRLLGSAGTASASSQAAKTQTDTARKVSDEAVRAAEMTQSAVTEATGGAQIRLFDKASYDQLNNKNPNTLYAVDNQGTHEFYIGSDRIDSQGGGGVIENGIILNTEQGSEWAPNHEVVPVEFTGGCSMWYGGMPARIVVQGLRVLVQVAEADILPDDLMTELELEDHNGVKITYKCIISSLNPSAGYARIRYYRNGQYLGQTGTMSIGSGSGFTEKTFGMVLLLGGWSLYDDKLCPELDMAFCTIIDGVPSRTSAFGLPGGYLSNPLVCSDAERGFGIAITRKTEPVT